MSEQTMRSKVVRMLKPLDGLAVENPVYPGTPDVNYIGGWIELKWMRRWKKNAWNNPVLIPHYTQQQRSWLRRRYNRGGRAFLLLQVGREWLLFVTPNAQMVGKVTRQELYDLAHYRWENGLKAEELRDVITRA
ncbi:MAG: hypothetical protein KAJ19_02200 [Gammaproteobacteria bacterium]|nr:hypothetical protein [Gammaproteobacteria bacterium]